MAQNRSIYYDSNYLDYCIHIYIMLQVLLWPWVMLGGWWVWESWYVGGWVEVMSCTWANGRTWWPSCGANDKPHVRVYGDNFDAREDMALFCRSRPSSESQVSWKVNMTQRQHFTVGFEKLSATLLVLGQDGEVHKIILILFRCRSSIGNV